MAVSMVAKKNDYSSARDVLVWVAVIVLGCAGAALLYYFEEKLSIFRLLLTVIGFCLLSFVATYTTQGAELSRFVQTSWREMQLVVWPNQTEVTSLSLVIVASVVIVSIVLWFIDSTLTKVFSLFLG